MFVISITFNNCLSVYIFLLLVKTSFTQAIFLFQSRFVIQICQCKLKHKTKYYWQISMALMGERRNFCSCEPKLFYNLPVIDFKIRFTSLLGCSGISSFVETREQAYVENRL